MTIILTEADAGALRDFLRNHFHDLQLEVARTETRSLRRELIHQEAVVERLLRELEEVPAPA